MHGSDHVRRLPAFVLFSAFALSLSFAACGDREGGEPSATVTGTATSPSATATVPATSTDQTRPTLAGPASRYTVLLDDLEGEWIAAVEATYVLALGCPPPSGGTQCGESSESAIFLQDDGAKLLDEWGYDSGYQTGAEPEGRLPGVLNGGYYWTLETHLFATDDGARDAYDYFNGRFDGVAALKKLPAPPVGNAAAAWEAPGIAIEGGGGVTLVANTVLFQRGNLLVVAQTRQASGFARFNEVADLVRIVDAKALGAVAAVEPTPINFGTATSTATPVATITRTATP